MGELQGSLNEIYLAAELDTSLIREIILSTAFHKYL